MHRRHPSSLALPLLVAAGVLGAAAVVAVVGTRDEAGRHPEPVGAGAGGAGRPSG